MNIKKHIVDGKVAVLYSPGFGAGWSTWGVPELAVDKDLVELFIADDLVSFEAKVDEKYPDTYLGGLCDLEVAWITEGTRIQITEYDGNEGIEFLDSVGFSL